MIHVEFIVSALCQRPALLESAVVLPMYRYHHHHPHTPFAPHHLPEHRLYLAQSAPLPLFLALTLTPRPLPLPP